MSLIETALQQSPRLMRDSSESHGQAEGMIDYVLSWCLRHAEDRYQEGKPILHAQCRHILFTLLRSALPPQAEVQVEKVETWKQWRKIDLCAEIELSVDGQTQHYALLIENKYYSNVRVHHDVAGHVCTQLDSYKALFEQTYRHKPHRLVYALFTSLERENEGFAHQERLAEASGYDIFSFYDVLPPVEERRLTESDIFNEFWLFWSDGE